MELTVAQQLAQCQSKLSALDWMIIIISPCSFLYTIQSHTANCHVKGYCRSKIKKSYSDYLMFLGEQQGQYSILSDDTIHVIHTRQYQTQCVVMLYILYVASIIYLSCHHHYALQDIQTPNSTTPDMCPVVPMKGVSGQNSQQFQLKISNFYFDLRF